MAAFNLSSGKQNSPAACAADESNIRTQTNHRPLVTTTRVWLAQANDVIQEERHGLFQNHDVCPPNLHQARNLHSASERAHLLFVELHCLVHGIGDSSEDEVLKHLHIFRIDG